MKNQIVKSKRPRIGVLRFTTATKVEIPTEPVKDIESYFKNVRRIQENPMTEFRLKYENKVERVLVRVKDDVSETLHRLAKYYSDAQVIVDLN